MPCQICGSTRNQHGGNRARAAGAQVHGGLYIFFPHGEHGILRQQNHVKDRAQDQEDDLGRLANAVPQDHQGEDRRDRHRLEGVHRQPDEGIEGRKAAEQHPHRHPHRQHPQQRLRDPQRADLERLDPLDQLRRALDNGGRRRQEERRHAAQESVTTHSTTTSVATPAACSSHPRCSGSPVRKSNDNPVCSLRSRR